MNEDRAKRVRSAAIAGWWTIGAAVGFLMVQWVAYLVFSEFRPGWLQVMWGRDMSWEAVQMVWLLMGAVFKLCVWVMALVVLWLTLWARRLAKPA
jgi:hypothetical protein